MKRIVSEYSGGADSVLATLEIHKKYSEAEIYPIYIDYGEKYNKQELRVVKKLIKKLKWLKPLHITTINLCISKVYKKLPEYIPLRNTVLSVIACQYANSIGADMVINGSKGQVKYENEPYSFFDSTVPHYKLVQATVNYAQEDKKPIQIISPLAENRKSYMEKEEVYEELLYEYNIGFNETWSCFKGGKTECGKCKNCKTKLKCKL